MGFDDSRPRPVVSVAEHGEGVTSVDQVAAFGVAALVLIVIPGPSVVFAIGRALSFGRGVALASVFGNALGLFTIVMVLAMGLGVVVQKSVVVFAISKIAGAAYLVWLGIDAFRRRKAFFARDRNGATVRGNMNWTRVVRQGYIVGVSNPKGFVIFAAVLPQFVDRGAGHVQLQLLMLGLLAVAIGLLTDSAWALLAGQLRAWFSGSPRRGETVGAMGGISMVGLGVGLALSGHRPES